MLNKFELQGRLVRDPELSSTPTGIEVCKFTVAWSDKYKETEKQCFMDCVAWRQTGVFVNTYFTKGQEIIVEGSVETRSYEDKNGNKRKAVEVIVDKAHFCGSKKDNQSTGASYQPAAAYTAPQVAPQSYSQLADISAVVDDGDLPF